MEAVVEEEWVGERVLFSDSQARLSTFFSSPFSGRPFIAIESPAKEPLGLAYDGTYLWIVDSGDDKIYKLDTSGKRRPLPVAIRRFLGYASAGQD